MCEQGPIASMAISVTVEAVVPLWQLHKWPSIWRVEFLRRSIAESMVSYCVQFTG